MGQPLRSRASTFRNVPNLSVTMHGPRRRRVLASMIAVTLEDCLCTSSANLQTVVAADGTLPQHDGAAQDMAETASATVHPHPDYPNLPLSLAREYKYGAPVN